MVKLIVNKNWEVKALPNSCFWNQSKSIKMCQIFHTSIFAICLWLKFVKVTKTYDWILSWNWPCEFWLFVNKNWEESSVTSEAMLLSVKKYQNAPNISCLNFESFVKLDVRIWTVCKQKLRRKQRYIWSNAEISQKVSKYANLNLTVTL